MNIDIFDFTKCEFEAYLTYLICYIQQRKNQSHRMHLENVDLE